MTEIKIPTIESGEIVRGGEYGPEIRVEYKDLHSEPFENKVDSYLNFPILCGYFIELLQDTKEKIFSGVRTSKLQHLPEINTFLGRPLLGITYRREKIDSNSKLAVLTENYYWDKKLDGNKKYKFNLHVRKGDDEYPEIRELEAVFLLSPERTNSYSIEKLTRSIIFSAKSKDILTHKLLPEGGLSEVSIQGHKAVVDFAKKDIDEKIVDFFLK